MNKKFFARGKREDTKAWVEGYLIEQNSPEYHAYIIQSFKAEIDNRHIDILECDIYEVIPKTVGWCTGWRDKNSTRIFEGDIVSDVNCEYDKYVVKFSDERCGFFPFAKGDGCGCCEINVLSVKFAEVIGNIHDNPELLK